MRKFRKVLSVICAIAMLASMFSMITVANADTGAKLTTTIVNEENAAGGIVELQFAVSGIEKFESCQFQFPLDGAIFDLEYDMVTNSSSPLSGAEFGYNARKKVYNLQYAGSMVNVADLEGGVICTAKLKLVDKLAAELALTPEKVAFSYLDGTTMVTYGTADVTPAPTIEMTADSFVLGYVEPAAKLVATVKSIDNVAGGIVTVDFTVEGELTQFESCQFQFPLDGEIFNLEYDMVTNSSSPLSGAEFGYNARKKVYNLQYAGSMVNVADLEDGVICTASLQLINPLTADVTLTPEKVAFSYLDGTTMITYGTADVTPAPTVIMGAKAFVVPMGGVTPPDTTEYTITVDTATVNGSITADAEKAVAGTTVNVTATPAEGYELDTITVNGEVISGTSFKMPAEDVTVSATFKEIVIEETPKALTLNVEKVASELIGSKYTIKATGEYADKFDIVINVYNTDGVSMGFVVYDEVAVDEEVVFYAPAKCTASVNAVDEISESNENLLGEMLANKVSK